MLPPLLLQLVLGVWGSYLGIHIIHGSLHVAVGLLILQYKEMDPIIYTCSIVFKILIFSGGSYKTCMLFTNTIIIIIL